MDSSRIFIRGLPPNLSAEEFAKHFSKPCPITDARVIQHRRIGYVGYKTSSDAAKAVKYFNKSFIHMSRIAVELARPVGERVVLASNDNLSAATDNITSLTKRKFEVLSKIPTNPKLQEFLDVMQPPSKSKIWANEGGIPSATDPVAMKDYAKVKAEGNQSYDQYEPVPRKRKRSPSVTSEKHVVAGNFSGEFGIQNNEEQAQKPKATNSLTEEEISHVPVMSAAAPSDADWLRSRTSRLLGLVDDDEDKTSSDASVVASNTKPESPSPIQTRVIQQIPGASSQMDAELAKGATEPTTHLNPKADQDIGTGRLFLRNLSYTTSEDELRQHFVKYGIVSEVHVPVEPRTDKKKGFAYVLFEDAANAQQALQDLDGTPFQGRLLHILPASAKKTNMLDDYALSKLPIKKQKQIRRKAEAASSTFKWNSLYMNADAVMSSISDRLGISKSEILDPTSSDAAVKQAHAETNIIQETKAYFSACGVNLEAFKQREFSATAILVKNFPYGTSSEELRKLFEAYGSVKRLLVPPSGTIAVIDFELSSQARSAFGALAYRKFKGSILFLEKAPKGVFDVEMKPIPDLVTNHPTSNELSATDLLAYPEEQSSDTATLFVRNLNFATTTDQLREVFEPLDGFTSARVKTKINPKKPGQTLSMGFGFLEFRSKEQAHAALAAMNGYRLDGHDLVLKSSHKSLNAAEQRRKEDQAKKIAGRRTKVIIKNLPFETSKKDVRALFGAYGKLRSVRVPKKFDSSTRGFAFADFVTAREAENAIDALRNTHLLGRRLVLDFANEEAFDPEEEIERMQARVGKQADKVALQSLTSIGRKKFHVEGVGGRDED